MLAITTLRIPPGLENTKWWRYSGVILCGFTLSGWKMHGRPWKTCVLEGSTCCCKISVNFSALMLPSQKWKWALLRALMHPHTITEPGCRDWLLTTVWMLLLLFGPEHTASISSNKDLEYWSVWPQYTFRLCDGPSRYLLKAFKLGLKAFKLGLRKHLKWF